VIMCTDLSMTSHILSQVYMFFGYKHPFSTLIQDNGFARLKTSIVDQIWKRTRSTPKKRGTNLETKLLKVKHIIKAKILSPLAYQNSFQNRCFLMHGLSPSTLKPNSSKSDTGQGQNSYTLAYQTPFQTCMAPHMS
jgi:hypothetical protein